MPKAAVVKDNAGEDNLKADTELMLAQANLLNAKAEAIRALIPLIPQLTEVVRIVIEEAKNR